MGKEYVIGIDIGTQGTKAALFSKSGACLAETRGGVKRITSVAALYNHLGVRFMPTGGVNMKNLAEYLSVKAIVAVGGAWIAKKDMIASAQWDAIKDNARAAVEVEFFDFC